MLAPDEPAAVLCERLESNAPFVVSCDHAGNRIPRVLGDLGLHARERERHIAWDIGALGVARELSARLDAPLVAQRYSRLVIDCNRPPGHPELIPVRSEATDIPQNRNLSESARKLRMQAIYEPYHAALARLLDEREARALPTVFVAVHSFTPVFLGRRRPWHVGVLHGSDTRLAGPVLAHFRAQRDLCVGDNEPYRIDGKDQGVPRHALSRGLAHVLFEIRQDLIAEVAGQRDWAGRLERALRAGVRALPG